MERTCYARLTIPFVRAENAAAFAARDEDGARLSMREEPLRQRWWVEVSQRYDRHQASAAALRELWARRAGIGDDEHVRLMLWPTERFDLPLSQQLDGLFGASRYRRAVSIAFFPTGSGWASGVVATPAAAVDVSASYLEDAFSDLATFGLDVLHAPGDARCSFAEEPGEYRWVAQPVDGATRLRLLSFPDVWSDAPDGDGAPLLEATCRPVEIASAIHRALQWVREVHGEDGFEGLWGSAFPTTAFRLLGEALAGDAGGDV